MLRRRTAFTVTVSVLALILTGCLTGRPVAGPGTGTGQNGESDQTGQVLLVNVGTDLETLDPGISTGLPEASVQLQLFEGLMRLDGDGRPVPGLAAAAPEVSPDGKTYTFRLREARWSNGDPITADDFVWSWRRALHPETASEYAYQLYYIKGGEALNRAEGTAEIAAATAALGVQAIDPRTLEVQLEAPTPYFDSMVAFHTLRPVHQATVEARPQDWFRHADTFVSSGPFKFVSWTPKGKIVLEKNPAYYDADRVRLDRIEYFLVDLESTATQMYESGRLHVVESGVNTKELPRLQKERPADLHITPDLTTHFYRFNVNVPPLNNAKVRRALALAIDRRALVENITQAGEVPAMALVPRGMRAGTDDFRAQGGDLFSDNDAETARRLLAAAGFPGGRGFPRLSILYNTAEVNKRVAEAIQQMWKQILDIDVTLENAEWSVFLSRQSSLNYEISRSRWVGDYIDPMTFIDMFVSGGGNNNTGWSNPQYDALVRQAKATGDQEIRLRAMHEAEKILIDEMAIAPLYYAVRIRLVSPRLKGWTAPITSGMDLREAYLE